MSYKLTVFYGWPGELAKYPSEFTDLNECKTDQAVGAFLRDMLGVEGSAVAKIVIEREPDG
jgi:hypothetical protein